MSFADVMKSDKNGRRKQTVTLCFSSDVDSEYRDLEVELDDALSAEAAISSSEEKRTNRRVAEKPQSFQIAERMKALREQNADAFYDVVLQALPRAEWLKLRSAHPPRDDEKADAGYFHAENFPPAAVKASMVDPEPTEDVIAWLEENLTSGDWERLALTAWTLNEGSREAPKLDRVSSILSGNANG